MAEFLYTLTTPAGVVYSFSGLLNVGGFLQKKYRDQRKTMMKLAEIKRYGQIKIREGIINCEEVRRIK